MVLRLGQRIILFILQSNIRPNTTKKSDCGQFTLYDLGSTDLRFCFKATLRAGRCAMKNIFLKHKSIQVGYGSQPGNSSSDLFGIVK